MGEMGEGARRRNQGREERWERERTRLISLQKMIQPVGKPPEVHD